MKPIAAFFTVLWLSSNLFVAKGQQPPSEAISNLIQHAVNSEKRGAAWSFDPSEYRQETQQLPIGVFDSGIGGLTVLEAILGLDAHNNETLAPGSDGQPDFHGERFVYLGDQANMPYGNYPAAGKEEYLRELILKDVVFLLGKRYWPGTTAAAPVFTKPPVKAIAIGCNTATAYGLEDIKSALKSWGIPVFVVGVVEAGARGVVEVNQRQSASDSQQPSVAILATVGTCNSHAYPKAIGRALGQAGRRVPTIVQQGFADLAAAIEGDAQVLKKRSVEEIIRQDLLTLVEEYRKSGNAQPIGSIVLGCTHFPLVQDKILAILQELRNTEIGGQYPYRSLVADRIQVVNPAELTARELFRTLARSRLRATRRTDNSPAVDKDLYFISIPNPRFPGVQLADDGGFTRDFKYGRATQRLDSEDTLVVPMTEDLLPASSLNLIKSSLPHVWRSMTATASDSDNRN